MPDEAVAMRYAMVKDLAQDVMQRMQQELYKLGFKATEATLKAPNEAQFSLQKDTASGEYSLIGEWRNAQGFKLGSMVFHADGNFFVEQDVVKNHPKDAKWFVEAVNAWGKHGYIKAEPRLLPLPPGN